MRLHYRNELNPLARRLRHGGIVSEALLWDELKQQKLGVRFLRQRPIANYIVDFFCHSLRLAIEIDGTATHNQKIAADRERQRHIEAMGIKVIRFRDSDVQYRLVDVVESIRAEILRRSAPPPLEKEE